MRNRVGSGANLSRNARAARTAAVQRYNANRAAARAGGGRGGIGGASRGGGGMGTSGS